MTLRVPGYEVERELGRGGMGVVLLARELATDRRVAIKVALEASPEQLVRFAREGELVARLDHPGIVRVHAARVADRSPYLVVELVEGARSLVEAGAPLPPRERALLVRDAARALGHAHARGVVHRDVKPENILVDASGRVRVTDFGVALASDLERLTRTQELVGTPAYMAPEQLAGRAAAVTPATDVWALGAVLFRLLTGRVPFPGATLVALMAEVTGGRAPRARSVAPDVPPALDEVVARALDPDPAARFADGEALAVALEAALGPGPATEPGRRASRGPLPAGAAGLLVIALVIALVVALALRPGPPPPAPPAPGPPQPAPVASPVGAAPSAPSAAWLETLRQPSAASRLRALEALDAELAAGRSIGPAQRAAATRRLRDGLPTADPTAPATFDLEVYDQLLWSHALLRRLDPAHAPSPEHTRILLDVTLIRPVSQNHGLGPRGLELARLFPDRLEGPLLHADGWSVLPAGADGEVLRRGLAAAAARSAAGAQGGEDPRAAWLRLAEVHAGWLVARAGDDPSLRAELAALGREAWSRLDDTPVDAARVLVSAARHAPPDRARELLRRATERGGATAEDHLARARAWDAVARAEGPSTLAGDQARGTAIAEALAGVDAIALEEPPTPARLELAGATVDAVLPPVERLTQLERLLARAPLSLLQGLAVRRLLARAEVGGTEEQVGQALALALTHLEAWRRAFRQADDQAWLDEGLALGRRLSRRPGAAAALGQLAPWWRRRRHGLVHD